MPDEPGKNQNRPRSSMVDHKDFRGEGEYVLVVDIHENDRRAKYFAAKKIHELWGNKPFTEIKQEFDAYFIKKIVVMRTNDRTQAEEVRQYFENNNCDAHIVSQSQISGINVF